MTALKRFDTLKSYNALKKSGVSENQAETLVEMIREATDSSIEHLATREDLANAKAELKEDIASVRTEVAEIKGNVSILTKAVFGFCLVVVINIILFWFHH